MLLKYTLILKGKIPTQENMINIMQTSNDKEKNREDKC